MRYILLVVVVLVVLVNHLQATGNTCQPCSEVTCEKPKGCGRRGRVMDACGCCEVCGTKRGQPCSGMTPRCRRALWCIDLQGNIAEARRIIARNDTFQGFCGRITI